MHTESSSEMWTRAFDFANTYVRLPERFYARVQPTPVAAPTLLRHNEALADDLGLDTAWLCSQTGLQVLAGNRVAPGSQPLAQAYAGHQFGSFVPQLGDGRALLLGEVIDRNGQRSDVQLKGSGRTPFSRRGDGRAAIGPVLREYLISEAMHALGIPTTRALAAVATGEFVMRETKLPGAVFTRVAASHVRVGTFQYFAARNDLPGLHELADYVIERHYPEVGDADNRALGLLHAVMARQTKLVARWLGVGFVHGVMNTDNTSISGETIDYGPCAFMDAFDSATVFSFIDQFGRYAYGAQPSVIEWNLVRLAETLLPLIAEDRNTAIELAQEAMERFPALMQEAWLGVMGGKLGLTTRHEGDGDLVSALLTAMQKSTADFTRTFRALCAASADSAVDDSVRREFDEPEAFSAWAVDWRARLAKEGGDTFGRADRMRACNPAYIPRNHLVEEALTAAENGDLAPIDELAKVLARPYDEQAGRDAYAHPPATPDPNYQTFCGT